MVCPDVVGRGLSSWLPVKDDYQLPTYVADMITLIARLDVDSVHWVGTSMGGLIGMLIASMPDNPIRRLVLNDVGPVVTAVSLARIGQYVGMAPVFPSFGRRATTSGRSVRPSAICLRTPSGGISPKPR